MSSRHPRTAATLLTAEANKEVSRSQEFVSWNQICYPWYLKEVINILFLGMRLKFFKFHITQYPVDRRRKVRTTNKIRM